MKVIKYIYHTIVNRGTDEQPNLVDDFNPVEIMCDSDETFNSNYAIAQKEAYNGEITVEEVPDDVENS